MLHCHVHPIQQVLLGLAAEHKRSADWFPVLQLHRLQFKRMVKLILDIYRVVHQADTGYWRRRGHVLVVGKVPVLQYKPSFLPVLHPVSQFSHVPLLRFLKYKLLLSLARIGI